MINAFIEVIIAPIAYYTILHGNSRLLLQSDNVLCLYSFSLLHVFFVGKQGKYSNKRQFTS